MTVSILVVDDERYMAELYRQRTAGGIARAALDEDGREDVVARVDVDQ